MPIPGMFRRTIRWPRDGIWSSAVLNPGQADCIRELDKGIPPFPTIVLVADLETPELAGQEHFFPFIQGNVGGGNVSSACFGDDGKDVGTSREVLKEGAEGLRIQVGLVEIR